MKKTTRNFLAKWYRAWTGEAGYVPHSQGDGIRQTQAIWSPLQAFIAFYSGRWAGDMDALKLIVSREPFECEGCFLVQTPKGATHADICELARQAKEVLGSDFTESQKNLLML